MTVIVFADKTTADAACKEITATPYGSVWCWYDPDQAANAVQYAQSADGRCAIAHRFEEQDRAWLEVYLAGMTGVQVLNSLPTDWQYPTDVI